MAYMSKGGVFLNFRGKYDSPLGPLLLESDGVSLTGLYMGREVPEESVELPVFRAVSRWLDGYFRGEPGELDFSIAPAGTDFQLLVWQILLTIPYGETRSYGSIAKEAAARMGREKMSAQAVGQAVGSNPLWILIPCHRCVGAKGQLTGYAGGLEKKKWLLNHEKAVL